MAEVIFIPWGHFEGVGLMWESGITADEIAMRTGYKETVIRMILKRAIKLAPVGK